MDCSSAHAMAGLIALKDRFDVAFGNDTDYDRHGIVVRGTGLLPPNHFLSAAVSYLLEHRPHWRDDLMVGKTLVQLDLRNSYEVSVISVRSAGGEVTVVPKAGREIKEGDTLVLVGKDEDLARVRGRE